MNKAKMSWQKKMMRTKKKRRATSLRRLRSQQPRV